MQLLEMGVGYENAKKLALFMEEYIPTLRRMNHGMLFDIQIAQAQATIMILLIPILSISFLWIEPYKVLPGIRGKGKENTIVALFFYALILALILFFGLNSRGPSGVFERTPYGFSVLSAYMTLPFGHYFRSILAIFFDK